MAHDRLSEALLATARRQLEAERRGPANDPQWMTLLAVLVHEKHGGKVIISPDPMRPALAVRFSIEGSDLVLRSEPAMQEMPPEGGPE